MILPSHAYADDSLRLRLITLFHVIFATPPLPSYATLAYATRHAVPPLLSLPCHTRIHAIYAMLPMPCWRYAPLMPEHYRYFACF